jgi:hypothetical protein
MPSILKPAALDRRQATVFNALWRLFGKLSPPKERPSLRLEAQAKARSLDPGTLVVMVDAWYLPHGGRDRITLELGVAGARIERLRTPERSEARVVERVLDAEQSARVLAELEERGIWTLSDHHERIFDGLRAEFAFARADRLHGVSLHAGFRDSDPQRLLDFLIALVP